MAKAETYTLILFRGGFLRAEIENALPEHSVVVVPDFSAPITAALSGRSGAEDRT
jgi:hypothetical protein